MESYFSFLFEMNRKSFLVLKEKLKGEKNAILFPELTNKFPYTKKKKKKKKRKKKKHEQEKKMGKKVQTISSPLHMISLKTYAFTSKTSQNLLDR